MAQEKDVAKSAAVTALEASHHGLQIGDRVRDIHHDTIGEIISLMSVGRACLVAGTASGPRVRRGQRGGRRGRRRGRRHGLRWTSMSSPDTATYPPRTSSSSTTTGSGRRPRRALAAGAAAPADPATPSDSAAGPNRAAGRSRRRCRAREVLDRRGGVGEHRARDVGRPDSRPAVAAVESADLVPLARRLEMPRVFPPAPAALLAAQRTAAHSPPSASYCAWCCPLVRRRLRLPDDSPVCSPCWARRWRLSRPVADTGAPSGGLADQARRGQRASFVGTVCCAGSSSSRLRVPRMGEGGRTSPRRRTRRPRPALQAATGTRRPAVGSPVPHESRAGVRAGQTLDNAQAAFKTRDSAPGRRASPPTGSHRPPPSRLATPPR